MTNLCGIRRRLSVMLSLVIPTFNRPDSLIRALMSLQGQQCSNFEVIVVDNAADMGVERQVREFNQRAKMPVNYVKEPRLGLHYARHAGARSAQGDLLVFTDDDATFDSGWLQAYLTAFTKYPEMLAAGGPVRPKWECSPPDWLLEFKTEDYFSIYSLMEPYQEFHLGPQGTFFGVNMAIRRKALFNLGGFNPEAFGEIWLGDGETGLNRKLRQHGMLIGYVPEAVVYHHISKQRMTVAYLCHRMANEGACDIYSKFHQGLPRSPYLFLYAISKAIKNSKYYLRNLLFKGRTDQRSLVAQLQTARTIAQIKYIIRLMFDKHLKELVLRDNWLNQS